MFIRWLQWLFHVCLSGRRHVLVNMDETSISSVTDGPKGWVVKAQRGRRECTSSLPLRRPCEIVHLQLMVSVTPDAALQPYLPQVLLTKLRAARDEPTARTGRDCNVCHDPLEFWHGTGGWPDHRVMCHWAARLRARIHARVPDAWILLILDCSTAHLDQRTLRRLKLLGILVVFVPAKMTWILQVCDVSVFAPFKAALRYGFLASRVTSVDSQLSQEVWLRTVGEVVSRSVSSADWNSSFRRCAQTPDVGDLHEPLARLLNGSLVCPRLPDFGEFADLVGRSPRSELTRELYRMVVSPQLALSDLPMGSLPRRGARLPAAPRGPARPLQSSRAGGADGPFPDVVHRNVRRRLGVVAADPRLLPPARNWAVPPHDHMVP